MRDDEPTSSATAAPAAAKAPENLELARLTTRYIHESTRDRLVEVDYVISNQTAKDFRLIYLPLPEFALNLRIHDEDGGRLNFLTNEVVGRVKERVKRDDPEGFRRFEERFEHVDYELAVWLPEGRELLSKSFRTIRLRYEAKELVRTSPILGPLHIPCPAPGRFKALWHQWSSRVFAIPYVEISTSRYPGHPYDHFFVILGLPEHSTYGKDEVSGRKPKKEIKKNGLSDSSRIASIRLPEAEGEPYDWRLRYEQRPSRAVRMGILSVYLIVMTAAALLGWVSYFTGVMPFLMEVPVLAAFSTSAVGVILVTNEPWEDRYQLLLVPLLIALVWLLVLVLLAVPPSPT